MNQPLSYEKDAFELIQIRSSWRSFKDESISESDLDSFETFLEGLPAGPFGSRARFRLLRNTPESPETLRGLGTYGFISGASAFLVGAISSKDPYHLEDYGYLMECLVLKLTDLGYQTCWLGGSFRRSKFAGRMELTGDEVIPAVSPVGIAREKRSLIDRMVRRYSGAWNRKPFRDLFGEIPETLSVKLVPPLEAVRLAPSATNSQPWRVRFNPRSRSLDFYMVRSPGRLNSEKRMGLCDLQRVDMGIALAHFHLTAMENRLDGEWKVLDPGHHPDATGRDEEEANYLVSWILPSNP